MRFYIVYCPMKTGSTTLFNRLARSVDDPVFHTHDMEAFTMLNRITEVESRVIKKMETMKGSRIMEGIPRKQMYNLNCKSNTDIFSIFENGDEVYVFSNVRNPLDQKISHVLHNLNLNAVIENDIDLGENIKEYMYSFIGKLMFEKTTRSNIYLQRIHETKSLVLLDYIIESWCENTRAQCPHQEHFRYINSTLVDKPISLTDIRDLGFYKTVMVKDNIKYHTMILKTEALDKLTEEIEELIGTKIKYNEKHRDKYDTNSLYLCRDNIDTVIRSMKTLAKDDQVIKDLYELDIVKGLGYTLPITR